MERPPLDLQLLLDKLGVRYERRGAQLWASCPHPEHRDSEPSWRMFVADDDPHRGFHHCYGCGRRGWPDHLVRWMLGCTAEEAEVWLEDVEGQAPPLPMGLQVDEVNLLRALFVLPPGVVEAPFEEWPEEPRDYLLVERGVEPWQVERWGLCYAPRGWDPHRNKMAGRVVFPVRDATGRLLSYTGRAYDGNKKRYKEPDKDERAVQGAMFGEQHWPPQGRNVVVVTEGALDALAVERVADCCVAGLYGSQLHERHVAMLSTFGRVIMAADPDAAGAAVMRKLHDALCRWVDVRTVRLPESEDCASVAPDVLVAALRDAGLHVAP